MNTARNVLRQSGGVGGGGGIASSGGGGGGGGAGGGGLWPTYLRLLERSPVLQNNPFLKIFPLNDKNGCCYTHTGIDVPLFGLHDSRCCKVEIQLILTMLLQLFTKAWTAGLLNGLGDAVSQKFVEKTDDLDFKRLGIFTLLVCYSSTLYSVSVWMTLQHRSGAKKATVAV